MKTYLVGGAVRDKLLKHKIKEHDWVVVGATPKEMLARGFKPVGRDFPVFLHPKTHEEYALARTERKTGKGYTQFQCYFDPSVTLAEDLKRRDLTINAMAQTRTGKVIDPYGGISDLKKKILRHVSEAFVEDPVRILRVARFAARFYDFKVHPKTNALMHQMLQQGEVDALVPERVWQELERALQEPHPERFFTVLKNCKVLKKLFPEIARNFSSGMRGLKLSKAGVIPSPSDFSGFSTNRPEQFGNSARRQGASNRSVFLLHDCCERRSQLRLQPKCEGYIRFAVLLHKLKPTAIKNFGVRYRVPRKYLELALLVAKYKKSAQRATHLSAVQLLNLLMRLDAYRRPERFKQFLATIALLKSQNATPIKYLQRAYQKTVKITGKKLIAQGIKPLAINRNLRKLRVAKLKIVLVKKSERN